LIERREAGFQPWVPVILALFAGLLLLTLVLSTSMLPFYVPDPLFPPEAFTTLHFVWDTMLGLLVVVSVLGVFATMSVAEGRVPRGSALDRFGRLCFLIVLFGLLAVVTLFLLEFNGNDAALFVVLEIGFVAVLIASHEKRPGSKQPPAP
jgi:hypothetical protein